MFGVASVWFVWGLGVERASGEVRGVNGEECSEWVAWSEGSDGQDLQYTAVGFVNFISEGDAVS